MNQEESAVWLPRNQVPRRQYHPAWFENTDFELAAKIFNARICKSYLRQGRGEFRYFFLKLPSSRCASLTTWNDFQHTIEFGLELHQKSDYDEPWIFEEDLFYVLSPLGVPMPTESLMTNGTFRWRAMNNEKSGRNGKC